MRPSVDSIRAALAHIPAEDRELWLRVGMALHAELGDEGFGIFDEWSKTAHNYDERAVGSVWRSFKPGTIAIGTLFFEARRRGYDPAEAPNYQPEDRPVVKAPSPARTQHLRLASFWHDKWNAMAPVIHGAARQYLVARKCVIPPAEGHLRSADRMQHPSGYVGPALVALVTDAITGEPLTLHRTWVQADGKKADVDPPRLLLGRHRKQGGAIRLFPDEEIQGKLAIAEGIETALTVAAVLRPAWSVIDAGNMAAFPVLEGVSELLIAADNDPAGLKAAEQCADRWYRAGRRVRIAKSPIPGEDLNDAALRAA